MKRIPIILFCMICLHLQVQGQIKVSEDNNVGIGSTAPVSKLAVNAAGSTYTTLFSENSTASSNQRAAKFYKSSSGGTWSYGMISHIPLTGANWHIGGLFVAYNSTAVSQNYKSAGLYSYAGNGQSGFNYGVWARLLGNRNGAAIYATTGFTAETELDSSYAGYFIGRVRIEGNVKINGILDVNGSLYSSDINLKKDIRYLSNEEEKHVSKLLTLSGIKYKLKTPTELGKYDAAILNKMKRDPREAELMEEVYNTDLYGLSAQEVQSVYPELVKERNDGYLGLNYIGLIPVLIEAIKEQEEVITAHETAIQVLQDELEALKEDVALLMERSESSGETK